MAQGKDKLEGIFAGRTVVCMASGPSLTAEDVAACAALPLLVCNTTYQMAPDADILFAMDTPWWIAHEERLAEFKGMKLCGSNSSCRFGATHIGQRKWFLNTMNSGSNLIVIAAHTGAAKILLLGYDCKPADDGRRHWHGKHPSPLGDAKSMGTWPNKMKHAGRYAAARGAKVINCSRDTALTCFERGRLEDHV